MSGSHDSLIQKWLFVNTADPFQKRHGRTLAFLLGGLVFSDIFITGINFVQCFLSHSSKLSLYILSDLIVLLLLLGVWQLNQSGRVSLAGSIFIICSTALISFLFSMENFERVLLYSIPILAASFTLRPTCSFMAATLATLGYTGNWFLNGQDSSYNFPYVFGFMLIALVAWTISRQLEKALEESRQREEALQKSQIHFRSLFEDSPIPLWEENFSGVKLYIDELKKQGVKDIHSHFTLYPTLGLYCESLIKVDDVNQAVLKMLHYNTKDQLLSDLKTILARGPSDVSLEQFTAISQGRTNFEWEGPNDVVDGRVRYHHIHWTIVSGYEHNYGKVIVAIQDITERRRMEVELVESQKLASLGTLAAGIAHEINSPLQIITGQSDGLLRRMEKGELEPERLKRGLTDISRSSWRVAEIVRSLLSYGRMSNGKVETLDLNVLVQDTLLLIEHQLRSRSSIFVTTDLAADLPPISCSRNEISQVLINLLTNARDAMPHGGQITVSTRCEDHLQQALIAVADTGKGIAPKIRERIFEPFFTTKSEGEGTGLGLSIVSKIIQDHGGEIRIESIPEEGTTFTIALPFRSPGAPLVQ
jgi:signal transduction histidine kinase